MSFNDPKKLVDLLKIIVNQSLFLKLGKGKELNIYSAFPMWAVPMDNWIIEEEEFLYTEIFQLTKWGRVIKLK